MRPLWGCHDLTFHHFASNFKNIWKCSVSSRFAANFCVCPKIIRNQCLFSLSVCLLLNCSMFICTKMRRDFHPYQSPCIITAHLHLPWVGVISSTTDNTLVTSTYPSSRFFHVSLSIALRETSHGWTSYATLTSPAKPSVNFSSRRRATTPL